MIGNTHFHPDGRRKTEEEIRADRFRENADRYIPAPLNPVKFNDDGHQEDNRKRSQDRNY